MRKRRGRKAGWLCAQLTIRSPTCDNNPAMADRRFATNPHLFDRQIITGVERF